MLPLDSLGMATRHIPERSSPDRLGRSCLHELLGYAARPGSSIIAGMNDATGNTTRDTTDRATRHDIVSVTEAADVLGITPDSVRARLRRGSLAGEKQGTTWRVHLDDGRRATRHDTPRDATRQRDATSRDVDLEPLAAVIRDQNHRIEELAAAAAFWQVRAQQAEDQLRQLEPGPIDPQTTPANATMATESPRGDDPVPLGVRAWWKRLWSD